MMEISEWLPNPKGEDAPQEWVELKNNGEDTVPLAGWRLLNGANKAFVIGNKAIPPGGYLLLKRSETKLTLRNQDETISLFDAQGALVARAEFLGAAPEGKSLNVLGGKTLIGEPTPGERNSIQQTSLIEDAFRRSQNHGQFLSISAMILFACAVSALVLFCFKEHDALSELFFERHGETG